MSDYSQLDPFARGGAFAYDSPEADADLKDSISQAGYLPGHPVIRDEHGTIIEGHRRDRIARELGLEPPSEVIDFGDKYGARADIRRVLHAYYSNRGGRSFADIRRPLAVHMVAELGWSQEAAASALNVSQKTISRDLEQAEQQQPADDAEAEKERARKKAEEDAKEAGKRRRRTGAGRKKMMPDPDEAGTPTAEFNRLAAQFGPFDLDVCATASNTRVATFYSPEQDGLRQHWKGVCWCNPPYSEVGKWTAKAAAEVAAGNAQRVVCLVQAKPGTGWWRAALDAGAQATHLDHRITFGGYDNPAPFESAILVFEPAPCTEDEEVPPGDDDQDGAQDQPAPPEQNDEVRTYADLRRTLFSWDVGELETSDGPWWDEAITRDWPAAFARALAEPYEVRVDGVLVGTLTFTPAAPMTSAKFKATLAGLFGDGNDNAPSRAGEPEPHADTDLERIAQVMVREAGRMAAAGERCMLGDLTRALQAGDRPRKEEALKLALDKGWLVYGDEKRQRGAVYLPGPNAEEGH